jgi:uncharacterized protein (TIGR03437 family)
MPKHLLWIMVAISLLTAPAYGQAQIGGGTCSDTSLTGNYAVTLSGRQVSPAGTFVKVTQSNGAVNFDGAGHVTFALSTNTNAGSSQQNYAGVYALPSNCLGTLTATIAGGDVANLSLAAYAENRAFLISGSDGAYEFAGGGSLQPSSCLISTLSGVYALNANGFSIAANAITGVDDLTGLLQFDGNGNITANWNVTSGGAPTAVSATGRYSLTSSCLYSATLTDGTGKIHTLAMSVTDTIGNNFDVIGTNQQVMFSGAAHASFGNPGQSVKNAGSYRTDYTPAGSVFALFGSNLATGIDSTSILPIPTTRLSTTVTVNGVPAPLYYVSSTQINAQLPVNTPVGLATIVVKNGNSTSNAAAFTVPPTGPGIITFIQNGQNRAVVVNQNFSVNTEATPAKVGDTVVAYFTGGGPVKNNGLGTGTPAPGTLSPVSNAYSVTVSGKPAASIPYVGLTPGSVGLYQVNFKIPDVAAGDHPIVLTIGGQASNAPVISVSN